MSVKSPCKLICKYDDDGICVGCRRTMEEIVGWIDYTDKQKLEVWRRIRERKNR
jgi:predicted Fe-S protein YdhL (DUF1289 family)